MQTRITSFGVSTEVVVEGMGIMKKRDAKHKKNPEDSPKK